MADSTDCPRCGDTCLSVNTIIKKGKTIFITIVYKDCWFFARVIICVDCFKREASTGLDNDTIDSMAMDTRRYKKDVLFDKGKEE